MKNRHQGLGKRQIVARMVTELKTLIYLSKNQPAYFNQIIRESEIRDEHALKNAINRLLETKQIKVVPNPKGPKNRKYFVTKNYRSAFSPAELKIFKKLKRIKRVYSKRTKKSDSLSSQIIRSLLLAEIYLPVYLEDDSGDPKLKQEIKRLQLRGTHRHGVSIENLKQMIILEDYYTKRYVCKKFGITVKAFEENIKRYPELQLLRKKLRTKAL